jgi:MFS superfamily sulfate permease-like transporter
MLLLVIYTASRPHLGVLGAVPGVPGAYGDVERHPDYHRVPELLVMRVEAALFYANANLVRDRIKKLVGASDPLPRALILELTANAGLDITSAEMLEQLIKTLHSAGIDIALADLRQPVVDVARRTGLLEMEAAPQEESGAAFALAAGRG